MIGLITVSWKKVRPTDESESERDLNETQRRRRVSRKSFDGDVA
jgi:hypothetical protein